MQNLNARPGFADAISTEPVRPSGSGAGGIFAGLVERNGYAERRSLACDIDALREMNGGG